MSTKRKKGRKYTKSVAISKKDLAYLSHISQTKIVHASSKAGALAEIIDIFRERYEETYQK